MAAKVVAFSQNSYSVGSNGNIAVTKPAGALQGDLMVVALGANISGSHTWSPPTGWTAIVNDGGTNGLAFWVGYRVATASEPASWNWKINAFTDGGWFNCAIRGAEGTPTITASTEFTSSSLPTSSLTFNSVSLTGSQDVISLLIGATNGNAAATATWPAGWNTAANDVQASDGTGTILAAFNPTDSTTSSLSSQTATLSGSGFVAASVQLAIKIAAGTLTYPLVASLYNKTTPDQSTQAGEQQIAQASLVVQNPGWWRANAYDGVTQFGVYLKSLNAALKALLYYRSVDHNPADWYNFSPPGNEWLIGSTQFYLPPEWILCYAGTTTGQSLSATSTPNTSTTIVIGGQPTVNFATSGTGSWAVIGTGSSAELVQVTAVVSSTVITIKRNVDGQGSGGSFASPTGLHFTAPSHTTGQLIRPVALIAGAPAWNITSSCPTSSRYTAAATWPDSTSVTALTWQAFFAKFLANLAQDSHYSGSAAVDGFFLDNWDDRINSILSSPTQIDADNNNVAEGLTQTQYNTALLAVASSIRTANQTAIIVANPGGYSGTSDPNQPANSGGYGAWLRGGMVEGVRHGTQAGVYGGNPSGGTSDEYGNTGTLATDVASTKEFITDWVGSNVDGTVILNGSPVNDTAAATDTDYQAARFLLAEACIDGAYLAYDEYNSTDAGFNHHRFPWFDEFAVNTGGTAVSGNANGWLGKPTGAATTSGTAVYRQFEHGLALVNEGTSSQTVTLPAGTWKRLTGTQDSTTNSGATAGATVTIPAQDGLFLIASSGTAYTLTAAQGNLTITGQTATLRVAVAATAGTFAVSGAAAMLRLSQPRAKVALLLGLVPTRVLAATTGTFTVTGEAAMLRVSMSAATGTFTLTGQAVHAAYRLTATSGTLAVTGQPVTLRVTLPAAAGTLAITGNGASLTSSRHLTAAAGTFTVSGEAAGKDFALTAVPGSFTVSGQAAQLTRQRTLSAVTGTFALTGEPATLSTNAAAVLTADPGSFAVAGQAAVLRVSMPAAVGDFALTGQPANLTSERHLTAATGAFTVTGEPAALTRQHTLPGTAGSFVVNGQPAHAAYRLTAIAGTFTESGQAANLVLSNGLTLIGSRGTFVLTGEAAALESSRHLTATSGTFAITGEPAGLSHGHTLSATTGTFTVTGEPAHAARTNAAASGSFSVVGEPATFHLAYRLSATTGTFALTGEPAAFVLTHGLALAAATGAFTLTPEVAAFIVHLHLVAATGIFTLTGEDATLARPLKSKPSATIVIADRPTAAIARASSPSATVELADKPVGVLA